MHCSLRLKRITSAPGLAWHISRTWNFRARQQGAGMETEKTADILHTCLCRGGLSAGILNKSHPRPTWSRALGQLSFSAHSPCPDQTCWENTVGHSVLRGPQNTTKQEESWEGQGREAAVIRSARGCHPIPTLRSAPHVHTEFSQRWDKKPEAPLKPFPF